uniref:Uncharacterized protein n=1 Tax=Pelodiscus sinensis TaxID=13735 RepID=K7GAP2_PELSI
RGQPTAPPEIPAARLPAGLAPLQLLPLPPRHRVLLRRLRCPADAGGGRAAFVPADPLPAPDQQEADNVGSPRHRLRSPLHASLQASPLSSSSPFLRATEFSFDASVVRRTLEEDEQPSSPLTRYQPLTNASSQEALGCTPTSSPPKSCHSSDSSPIYTRRDRRAERHSEDDASPPEPASPTIGLDKKTRRKFLDLG